MSDYALRVIVCHQCPDRGPIADGGCACRLDGIAVTEHARRGYCPASRFAGAPAEPVTSALPAVPHAAWPLAVRIIRAKLATREDAGIGDTVARNLNRWGVGGEGAGDLFKRLYKRWVGSDCGCAERQAALNAAFPLKLRAQALLPEGERPVTPE